MTSVSESKSHENIHIFINRVTFDETDGVKPIMSVAEIAELAKVDPANAVVRLENGPDKDPLDPTKPIAVKNGMQFLVTRKNVEGGSR
jgi:hypothetical protein